MADGVVAHLNVCASRLGPAEALPSETAAPPCLVVNPTSFRASRGLAGRAIRLGRQRGADVIQANCADSIDQVVAAILARRPPRLIILAGDGTVQGIVDRLMRSPAAHWAPEFLVLPGGRSNLTSRDVVPRGQVLSILDRALQAPHDPSAALRIVERATLRVEQAPAPARYGFFVGAALIDDGVRICREHRLRSGPPGPLRNGSFSTVWCLLKEAWRGVRGRSSMRCPELALDAGALGAMHQRVRLLLVSTLQHPGSVFDPYAARGAGEVRVTAVSRHARHFWRALWRVACGRFTRVMTPEAGYLSGRCERLEVCGLSAYSLDGEGFDTDPERPVVFTAGPRLRFLRP